jgi:hypothetical protein
MSLKIHFLYSHLDFGKSRRKEATGKTDGKMESEWIGRLAGGFGIDPAGSGLGRVAGSCKYGDESASSDAKKLVYSRLDLFETNLGHFYHGKTLPGEQACDYAGRLQLAAYKRRTTFVQGKITCTKLKRKKLFIRLPLLSYFSYYPK